MVGRFVASFCVVHVWVGRGWIHLKKYTLSCYVACLLLQTLGGQKGTSYLCEVVDFKRGQAMWLDALSHSVENTGTVDVTGVLVELKK